MMVFAAMSPFHSCIIVFKLGEVFLFYCVGGARSHYASRIVFGSYTREYT